MEDPPRKPQEKFLRPLLPRSAMSSGSRALPARKIVSRAPIIKKPKKVSVRNPHTGCYIAQCRIKKCNLLTHQRLPGTTTFDPSTLKEISSDRDDRIRLLRQLIPFPSFSDPMLDDADFRNLFHQYVAFDMPRIVALMAPPPAIVSADENIKAKQQSTAHLALLDPVYFLLFTSMGHILELVRRGELRPDRISARLYGRLMQLLREKLDNYHSSQAVNLVLAILALSSFDMSLGNMKAVHGHREGLQHLVSHVGLSYLGRSLPYVVSWDRLMAAYTRKPSLFAKMPDRQFLRPHKREIKYGAGFRRSKPKLCLDEDVSNLCFDVCSAIDIVEAEDWTFRPDRLSKPFNATDVQYLYYMRDVIQNSCIVLQARTLANPERSGPIVFAAMIIQYIVLGKNDLPWYSTAVADRLYDTLAEQDLDDVWRGCEEVLCWLMCVMMVVDHWKQRKAALKLFREWVETDAGIVDNEMTCKSWDGVCNPQAFIWSDKVLNDSLRAAVKEYRSSKSAVKLIQVGNHLDHHSLGIIVSCQGNLAPDLGDDDTDDDDLCSSMSE